MEAGIGLRRVEAALHQDSRVVQVHGGIEHVVGAVVVDDFDAGTAAAPGPNGDSLGTSIVIRLPAARPSPMGSDEKILRGRRLGWVWMYRDFSLSMVPPSRSGGTERRSRPSVTLPYVSAGAGAEYV